MTASLTGIAAKALNAMRALGNVEMPSSANDIPEKGWFVYLVGNGENVLQLGKGDGKRARKCVRGGLAGKHNKAFICATGELVLGRPNCYATLAVGSQARAEEVERAIHEKLGIRTNKDGATIIRGIETHVIRDIHVALWEKVKSSALYRERLDEVERAMAEELFEVVTFGRTCVRRTSGKVVRSVQGDNLEGNILMSVGRRHLANVFIKLTDEYLRYGVHRMNEPEFASKKAEYTYSPRRMPFDLCNFELLDPQTDG